MWTGHTGTASSHGLHHHGPLGALTAGAGVAGMALLHPCPVDASNSLSCSCPRTSLRGSVSYRPTLCSTSLPAAVCAWSPLQRSAGRAWPVAATTLRRLRRSVRSSYWPRFLQGLAPQPRWPSASLSWKNAVLVILFSAPRNNSSYTASLARGKNATPNLISRRQLTVLAEQPPSAHTARPPLTCLVDAVFRGGGRGSKLDQGASPHLHPGRTRWKLLRLLRARTGIGLSPDCIAPLSRLQAPLALERSTSLTCSVCLGGSMPTSSTRHIGGVLPYFCWHASSRRAMAHTHATLLATQEKWQSETHQDG